MKLFELSLKYDTEKNQMFELGATVSNIVLQSIATRQLPVEVGGTFIQNYFVYIKDTFKEESQNFLMAQEVFMEFNQMIGQIDTLC